MRNITVVEQCTHTGKLFESEFQSRIRAEIIFQ